MWGFVDARPRIALLGTGRAVKSLEIGGISRRQGYLEVGVEPSGFDEGRAGLELAREHVASYVGDTGNVFRDIGLVASRSNV